MPAQHSVPAAVARKAYSVLPVMPTSSVARLPLLQHFFFATCMAMVYIHTHSSKHGLDFSDVKQTQQAPKPATPAQNNTTPVAPNPQQQ